MASTSKWWVERREDLISIYNGSSPRLVSNEEAINDIFFDFLTVESIDRIFYPVQKSSHKKIIRKAYEMGLSLSCNMIEDIEYIHLSCPGITPDRILFLPKIKNPCNWEHYTEQGTLLAFKDIKSIEACKNKMFDKSILMSLEIYEDSILPNPDQFHSYLIQFIGECKNKVNADVVGAHIGTYHPGGDGSLNFFKTISPIMKIIKHSHKFAIFSLGSSVVDKLFEGHKGLNFNKLSEYLETLKKQFPKISIWIELSRCLISQSDILLMRAPGSSKGVHKHKTSLVDISNLTVQSANDIISPEIINLSRFNDNPTSFTCSIVKNDITDRIYLRFDRSAPIRDGDILLLSGSSFINSLRAELDTVLLPARQICQVKL